MNHSYYSNSKNKTHESPKQAWEERLYVEHAIITYDYGIKLRKPLIEIDETSGKWGEWDSYLRILKISRRLITTHSWDTVINVLKHEMAHQIVTELFSAADSHGPMFLRACNLIEVPIEFRRATLHLDDVLPDWRQDPTPSEDEALLRKVERLLALAESSNEHEAFLAMNLVQQLFKKYNIERLSRTARDAYVYAFLTHKKKRIEKTSRFIASLLSEHYFITAIFAESFDAETASTYKVIEIMGTRQNVLMAEYVYYFLMQRLDILWKNYSIANKSPLRHKASYQVGLIAGFRKKLEAGNAKTHPSGTGQSTQTSSETGALLCLESSRLEEFQNKRHPKLQTVSRGGGRVYLDSYNAGETDGEKIALHRGISDKKEGIRLLSGTTVP